MYGVCVWSDKEIGLVMEFMPRGSLHGIIARSNVPMKLKLDLLIDVSEGLKFLHKKHVVSIIDVSLIAVETMARATSLCTCRRTRFMIYCN